MDNSNKLRFCWAPYDFSVGATVSTGIRETSMQECTTKIYQDHRNFRTV